MTFPANGAYTGGETYEYLNLGSKAAPTWAQIVRAEDVDLPNERAAGEVRFKGDGETRAVRGAFKRSIKFKYRPKKAADPVYDELKACFDDRSLCVEYAAMNGDMATSGSKGWRGPFVVTKFDETRPYENAVEIDVEMMVADAEDPEDPGNLWGFDAITIA